MSEESWGTKRQCPECQIWFYDFRKQPIECPGCHTSFDEESFMKLCRYRGDSVTDSTRRNDQGADLPIDEVASEASSAAGSTIIEDTDELADGTDIEAVKDSDGLDSKEDN